MPIHRTPGLVLRTIDYSETSLIVWLYTQTHGRVHVIAKGARRARSPFEGALEPLVLGELVFYRKARADALDIAKEFDPTDLHRGLRQDLARMHRGAYLAELLTELSEADAPSEAAWRAVTAGLDGLARGPVGELDAVLFGAELALIQSAGLAPGLRGCTTCGRPDAGLFSIPSGGLLCEEHARRDPAAKAVAPGALKTLAALAAGEHLRCGRELAGTIRALLDDFLAHHLGKRLRTQRYLAGPGPSRGGTGGGPGSRGTGPRPRARPARAGLTRERTS
ncbi:MAG: DNA repair protein RecO [Planctomycetota bacterium]